jgi:hypothetical protein
MVRYYYPFDKKKTFVYFDFLDKENNNEILKYKIEDFLDNRFCRHVYKFGKNKGQMCLGYIKSKRQCNIKPFMEDIIQLKIRNTNKL